MNTTHSTTAHNTPQPSLRSAKDAIIHGDQLARINFLRVTTELLQEAISADRRLVDAMKQELALIDPASLCIHKKGDRVHFGRLDRDRRTETGISQDRIRIHALARRAFLESRLKTVEASTRRLDKILHSVRDARESLSLRRRLTRYGDAGLDLCQVIFTPEQNAWINQAYSPNPYNQESLRYPTGGMIRMRSKSEAFFGSKLELAGLPFRYDDLITIHHDSFGETPFRASYFADFKIPNLLGGITVHEHFGAFHLEQYDDHALQRLLDYRTFMLEELPGRPVADAEITWSFERDLRDPILFKKLLKRILLPTL